MPRMRKHVLGATRPARGWCESFKPPREGRSKDVGAAPAIDLDGERVPERRSTVSASRFPTWKGGKRTEKLRHYFHEDMACLLETDPEVIRWSAQVEPLEVEYDDGQMREYPQSMWAQTSRGMRHIILRHGPRHPGSVPDRDKRPEPLMVRGRSFETYTRADLAAHPRLRTSQDILFHRSRELEPELPLRVAAMSAVSLPATLGDLHRRLGHGAVAWEDVVCLVAQGYVVVDLAHAVGPAMPLVSCNPFGYLL